MAAQLFLVHIDLNKNEVQNAVFQNLGAAPGTPTKGQFYFDTVGNKLNVYNGATWDVMGSGSGAVSSVQITQPALGFTVTPTGAQVGVVAFTFTATTEFSNSLGMTTAGIKVRTGGGAGAGTYATRQMLAGVGMAACTNPAGVAGDITINAAQDISTAGSPTFVNPSASSAPTVAAHLTRKDYVDGLFQGISWKNLVRAATTVAGTLVSSFANGSVIDGTTLATNDRILIKNQAAPAENGIYTVNAAGAPTRALDMDVWAEVPNACMFAAIGTANMDTSWVCTSDPGGTLGTTAINFVQLTSATGLVSLTSGVTGILPIANGGLGVSSWYAVPGMRRASAVVCTATNVTISAPGATLDGFAMSAGQRVLLVSQTTSSQNGLWIWNGAASAMTRPADYPAGGATQAYDGLEVFVNNGTLHRGETWIVLGPGGSSYTIDSSSVPWTATSVNIGTNRPFGILGSVYGGSGADLSAAVQGAIPYFSATGVEGASAAGTAGQMLQSGGTGAPVFKAYKFAQNNANAATTTVTHNLGTTDIQVQMWELGGSKRAVITEFDIVDANNITVNHPASPAAGTYRIVVLG